MVQFSKPPVQACLLGFRPPPEMPGAMSRVDVPVLPLYSIQGQVNHANLLLLAARIVPEFLVFAGHSKPMQHCLIEVQVLASMRTAGNPGPAQPLTLFLQVTI